MEKKKKKEEEAMRKAKVHDDKSQLLCLHTWCAWLFFFGMMSDFEKGMARKGLNISFPGSF